MKTSMVMWHKEGISECLFNEYKRRHLITTDLSVIPKDGKYHHLVINKSPLKEDVFVDGKKLPFALLPNKVLQLSSQVEMLKI